MPTKLGWKSDFRTESVINALIIYDNEPYNRIDQKIHNKIRRWASDDILTYEP